MTDSSRVRFTRLRGLMRKEMLALARDLHGLAALFVMPLLFIVIMTLALQDQYKVPPLPRAYAVLNHDAGAPARALLARWRGSYGAAENLPADWQGALTSGRLGYVLVIDPGFSKALTALTQGAGGARIHLMAEPGISPAVLLVAEASLERAVGEMRAQLLMAELSGLSQPSGPTAQSLVQVQRFAAGPRPTAVQQNVPAWLVFGMFFVVAALATLFVEERRCGALSRLLNLGVTPGQLLLSKALPYLGVNAVQALLMLAVGVWLVPLLGGQALSLAGVHLGALALMLACISAAAVGVALLLAVVLRTSAQALAVGPLLNVLMAAIGGIMVPTFFMPAAMQNLAHWSPMNWALEGLLTVMVRGGGVAALAPQALSLLGLAAVTLVAASLLLRRQLRP